MGAPIFYSVVTRPVVMAAPSGKGELIYSELQVGAKLPLCDFTNYLVYNSDAEFFIDYDSENLVELTRKDMDSKTNIRVLHHNDRTIIELMHETENDEKHADFLQYDKLIKQRLDEYNIKPIETHGDDVPVHLYDGKTFEGVLSNEETKRVLEGTDSFELLNNMKNKTLLDPVHKKDYEWVRDTLKSI